LRLEADIAIVGSGFAGSLTALALCRLGRSVVLLERSRHPRFAIGESSTPLANLLLEQLCDRYGLDPVRPLTTFGTWQRTYPQMACGLKRGFSFYRHTPGQLFADDLRHDRQLLVAASPHDEISDMHWYRPEFDAFLVTCARDAGATYVDETAIGRMEQAEAGVLLTGIRQGQPITVAADFVIDASGPRGFLHRTLGLDEAPLQWLPPTQTLYAHFSDVQLWRHVWSDAADDQPPFPVDAAALHHVFPGGWIWVLRFNNGLTSAGAALTDEAAAAVQLSDGAEAWRRLLDRVPSVGAQFARSKAVTPFTYAPRLAYRSREIVGRRWAMLPSAAGVIDPLLSTGFPLTLLGIHRLVESLEHHWGRPELAMALGEYAQATERELDATEQLVAALYASMADFELFKRLTLLYFAAASFSETARRLGREERAAGFLLCDVPAFASEVRACALSAISRPGGSERTALVDRIDRAIEPFDVAGLGDRERRDWYPVRADDLMQAASRFGATPGELHALLERCGFAEPIVDWK
jgi:FADH2 O2-dependent halogenase